MPEINYLDRQTNRLEKEKVYGGFLIRLLYGHSLLSRTVGVVLRFLSARFRFLSHIYGYIQSHSISRWKIAPFIRRFHVDETEFLEPVQTFRCFNDFFIRRLKPECRPIAPGHDVAVMPADGRYLVFENIATSDGFTVKGVKFSLGEFLPHPELAAKYQNGSMVLIRLCPVDYHRFHFPFNCIPQDPWTIDGALYSVNAMALQRDIQILTKNQRMATLCYSKPFGSVLFVEVGATYVGTICSTFVPHEPYAKGDEKGYFAFGGSCIVMLFEPGRIQFDQDLLTASANKIEVRGLFGQTLGRSLTPL